jgi:hypothetical protein
MSDFGSPASVALRLDGLEREFSAHPLVRRWLDWVGPKLALATSPNSVAFRTLYAAAARRLGEQAAAPLSRSASLSQWVSRDWTTVDCARYWMLCTVLGTTPKPAWADAVEQLFERGELGEQVCLLRTLSALPEPSLFVALGVSACRSNATSVFEAIACENPYPAQHFDELAFNQMAMKAVFSGVSLERVEGLSLRLNPDLKRMAGEYAAERRAAGRTVPQDLKLIDPEIRS